MKNIKKLFLLLSIISVTISCSKDDGPIKGCMDPLAANYNSAAEESDGSCEYSLIGDWELTKYTLDSTNVLASYKYLYFDVYANSTYDFWGEANDGTMIQSLGTYVIGSSKTTITMTPNNGSGAETYTITQLNGKTISMSGNTSIGTVNISAFKL